MLVSLYEVSNMYQFEVHKMTCGHCERAIRNEIEDLDQAAMVTVDLEQKIVTVNSTFSAAEIQQAIELAGYPAEVKSV